MTELATAPESAIIPAVNIPAYRNPALVYLASIGVSSRRPMRQSLDLIAEIISGGTCDHVTLPWGSLRYQHTQAIRSALAERCSSATANRHLVALRRTLKAAWRLKYMSAEDYQIAVDLDGIKNHKAPQAEKGRHLAPGEFAAMMSICDDGTLAGARDACLIAIGYLAGLRRAELAALTVADYDADACTILVRRGKGNKERVIPIGEQGCEILNEWLLLRGDWPGPLFVHVRKGDHDTDEGLTGQAVYHVLNERAQQAGVKRFSPHDLRRTFAGDLLDLGVDISTVQKLMGHASSDTTAGYDRRDVRAKRVAVSKLHIPYRSRRAQCKTG